jgi:Transcription factor WhiB
MMYDPERSWMDRALCRGMPTKVFFPPRSPLLGRPPSDDVRAAWEHAKTICDQCPVLAQCRRDTLGEEYGVWGGLDEGQRARRRADLARQARRWPPEKRQAWGAQLHALHSRGITWTRIRRDCGIAPVLGQKLIAEYREAKKQREAEGTAARKAAPAVTPKRAAPPFPTAPGDRHAWVRRGGLVRDAWYRAQTHDGVWVQVQVDSGRGRSMAWVHASDVHMYYPQPKVIAVYVNRPDRTTPAEAG